MLGLAKSVRNALLLKEAGQGNMRAGSCKQHRKKCMCQPHLLNQISKDIRGRVNSWPISTKTAWACAHLVSGMGLQGSTTRRHWMQLTGMD